MTKAFFTTVTSSAVETKETPKASTPCSIPKARSSLSLEVKERVEISVSGRLTPLCEVSVPPSLTCATSALPSLPVTTSSTLPSSMATWMVRARSWAEMPVVTPSRASIETVKAVPNCAVFS